MENIKIIKKPFPNKQNCNIAHHLNSLAKYANGVLQLDMKAPLSASWYYKDGLKKTPL